MKSLSSEHAPTAPVIAATAASLPEQADALARARAFAEPLLSSAELDTGENVLAHADAVARILQNIGGSQAMQAASYLVYACDYLNKPHEIIGKAFGSNFADPATGYAAYMLLQIVLCHLRASLKLLQSVTWTQRFSPNYSFPISCRIFSIKTPHQRVAAVHCRTRD